MDPLSVAANIVAVCSAASAIAKSLEMLKTLRHLPEQFLELLNEVADFRAVLVSIEETCRQTAGHSTEQNLLNQLIKKVDEAGEVLDALNHLIRTRLITSCDKPLTGPSQLNRISWKSWLRYQNKVQTLRRKISVLKQDITAHLTILTTSQHSLMSLEVKNIAITTNYILSSLRDSQAREIKHKLVEQHPNVLKDKSFPPLARVKSSLFPGTRCSTRCMCCCHTRITSRTPRALSELIGTLFLRYSGLPLLSNGNCSEATCFRQESCLVQVNYYFPRWLLSRVLVIRSSWSPLNDYNLTLRTPRAIPSTSELFLSIKVTNDSLSCIQKLFANGLASPFDVDERYGFSALHYATNVENSELCRFLLNQGADCNYEDRAGQSPLDNVWIYFLTEATPNILAMKDVFRPFMDLAEYISRHRFSILHRIVLGLISLDLEQQLQVTTSGINDQCSTGHTALVFAVMLNDLQKVRILLQYGSDVRVSNNLGFTAMHFAAKSSNKNSCEIIRALIQSFQVLPHLYKDSFDRTMPSIDENQFDSAESVARYVTAAGTMKTPLNLAIWARSTPNAKLLIENNADINSSNENGVTPLLTAIENNHHAILEILFNRKADIHAMDKKALGVLHYSARFADIRTLEILVEEKLAGLDSGYRDVDGFTPTEAFEMVRLKFIDEDVTTRSRARAYFEEILRNTYSSDLDRGGLGNYEKAIDMNAFSKADPMCEDEFFDAVSSWEENLEGEKG